MAAEVAPRELNERLFAREYPRRRHTRVEQRVRELFAAPPAAAHEAMQLREHEQVREALPSGIDPRALQRHAELVARQYVVAFERTGYRRDRATDGRGIKSELAVAPALTGDDAWAGEREHPADVLGRDEMPCRPQHVGPDDRTPLERAIDDRTCRRYGTLPDGPARGGVVLRLNGPEPADDVRGVPKRIAGKALALEAERDDGQRARSSPDRVRAGTASGALLGQRDDDARRASQDPNGRRCARTNAGTPATT